MAVRKRSLWVASPGDTSEPPYSDRSLGRRPSVTVFQRGTASSVQTLIGFWVVALYSHTAWVSSSTLGGGERTTSLPRESVRRDAYRQARPSDSGTPTPGHHLKLTRHSSYVCGGVEDGIQLRILQCEEDNLEALGEFIATAVVGHLPEKPLVENRGYAGEVVSSVGDTRHLGTHSV